MSRKTLSGWIALMNLCVPLATTSGANAAAPCVGPQIRADVELASEWLDALRVAKQHLSAQEHIDTCAEISVSSDPNGAEVSVRLRDGRQTVRVIKSPGDLSNVLESLTLIPAEGAPPPPAPKPRAAPKGEVRTLDEGRVEPPTEPISIHTETHEPAGVEVGLGPALALSVAPSYLGYGAGAHALVTLDRWLLQSQFVWHIEDRGTGQALPSGFNMQQLELGAGVGHRFELRPFLFDVVLQANAVIISQEAFGADPEGIGGAYGDLNLALGLRFATPTERGTRFFVGTSFAVFPGRVGRQERIDDGLPALPATSVTLTLGASWSVW